MGKKLGSFTYKYDSLPTGGRVIDDRLGWSETYWPSFKGGIAFRWNHPDPQPFKYKLHTLADLKKMSAKQLEQLSPAELYDVSQSDYNYTLTKQILRTYSPREYWWEGICDGWALSAINYPEPDKVVIKNKEGIQVPFGASDVKALISMHSARNKGGGYADVGMKCGVNGKVEGESDSRDSFPNPPAPELANSPFCRDLNAGSFHLVLANFLGIHAKGFLADIDRFNDIWNQPIVSYSSSVVGEEPVSPDHRVDGIERRLRVKTKMTYGEELKFWTPELEAAGHLNFVSKLPVTKTPHQKFLSKNYEYILELDLDGKVVGGQWISETRPDFAWTMSVSKTFQNAPIPLKGLTQIYRPVRR